MGFFLVVDEFPPMFSDPSFSSNYFSKKISININQASAINVPL
jgi:hypothetical protein